MDVGDIWVTLALAFPVAAISMTITTGSIFKGFRKWADLMGEKSLAWRFVGDLVHCPYCFSHWVSFAMAILYQPRPLSVRLSVPWLDVSWAREILGAVDLVVAAFMIVAVSAILCGLIKKSIDVIHGGK